MELRAILRIEGMAAEEVESFEWGITQSIDEGKERSAPRTEDLKLVIISSKKNELEFGTWAADQTAKKNGVIEIIGEDDEPGYTIDFKEAACAGFKIFFDKHDDTPMNIALRLSSKNITLI